MEVTLQLGVLQQADVRLPQACGSCWCPSTWHGLQSLGNGGQGLQALLCSSMAAGFKRCTLSACVHLLQRRCRCIKERTGSASVLAITRHNRAAALGTDVFIWKLYERLHRNNVIDLERR